MTRFSSPLFFLTKTVSSDEKRHSGLSNMLAAFPPPGLATPTGTPRPLSSWPAVDAAMRGQDSESAPRRPRRCCGLPRWVFLFALLILLIIIAAAIVVPLELLVLHKPKSKAALSALQQCEQNPTTMCQNGGTSFISTDNCACICVNGFTGSTCNVTGASGCTTTTITSDSSSSSLTHTNVTLGDAIPRLIAQSQTNFSIPLLSTAIIARFNSANLSCVSENALVTFDGLSEPVGASNTVVTPSSIIDSFNSITSSTVISYAAAATSNGIVYDPVASPPSTTASSAASQASLSPNATFSMTEKVLDFARVAVLFVLQQEQLDAAVSAQSQLQRFFNLDSSTNEAAQNVSLGDGNSINLLDFTVSLGSGSVGSVNASTTKRSFTGRRSLNLWSHL